MWGDQVACRVPTNNRWPISVTSHHLALTTWLLALRHCTHLRTESNGRGKHRITSPNQGPSFQFQLSMLACCRCRLCRQSS